MAIEKEGSQISAGCLPKECHSCKHIRTHAPEELGSRKLDRSGGTAGRPGLKLIKTKLITANESLELPGDQSGCTSHSSSLAQTLLCPSAFVLLSYPIM